MSHNKCNRACRPSNLQQMKHTYNDGLRMVGHLLEHHPTTGWYARNEAGQIVSPHATDASCWCLSGACMAVEKQLGLKPWSLGTEAFKLVFSKSEPDPTGRWDRFSSQTRLLIARKLQGITDE